MDSTVVHAYPLVFPRRQTYCPTAPTPTPCCGLAVVVESAWKSGSMAWAVVVCHCRSAVALLTSDTNVIAKGPLPEKQ